MQVVVGIEGRMDVYVRCVSMSCRTWPASLARRNESTGDRSPAGVSGLRRTIRSAEPPITTTSSVSFGLSRRNVELREIGDTALFLASYMASGITGEVIHVDCGYSIMAV